MIAVCVRAQFPNMFMLFRVIFPEILSVPYVIAKFFQGGYRTKMKIWSENFLRASGAQKKGFANFSPAPGFFVVETLKNH